jgi:ABC-type transporter Mla subunit MlaD
VSRRATTGLAASPLLVGAITVLITIVAVFLSYNANSGLPFVPTYTITAELPDAEGLQAGREVRTGGARIGVIEDVDAIVRDGRPIARLELKLEKRIEPVRADTVVAVRPLSPLGLKYLDLTPGRRGRELPEGTGLPLSQAKKSVDLATTLGAFEAGSKRVGEGGSASSELARRGAGLVGLGTALAGPVAALAGVAPASAELGVGTAGRGIAFNRVLEEFPPFLRDVRSVSNNLADPRTGLRRFLSGGAAFTGELAAARDALGGVVAGGAITFAALAAERAGIDQALALLPGTESAGTDALRAANPVLADAEVFLREALPGLRVIQPAARSLDDALDRGIAPLRGTPGLARRLDAALRAVDGLSRDPATSRTLTKLRQTLEASKPTLDYLAPGQTVCNYFSLFVRNAAEAVSEGDASGNWLRFIAILNVSEMLSSATPAADLHTNPYPNAAAPGQGGECESGREPFLPGQRIGNVPGFQGGSTEATNPSTIVPRPQE